MIARVIARKAKRRIQKLLGFQQCQRPSSARDLATRLPGTQVDIIFDVGANVGKSALEYCSLFPKATIYAFEPAAETFQTLRAAASKYPHIKCHQMALSSVSGTTVFQASPDATMHRVAGSNANAADTYYVTTSTVDEFCRENGIDRIGFMKIDTEGHEPHVLAGADIMLSRGAIDVVEVECGMNKRNTYHAPFEVLKALFEERDYLLFRLYDQLSEWQTKEPQMRRANAVFISPAVIKANTGLLPYIS